MLRLLLAAHEGLVDASRLPSLARSGDRVRPRDIAVLLFMGVATATLGAFVKLRLGIPGSAIVLSVIPIAIGLAVVPRYGAGTVMSLTAFGTLAVYNALGWPVGTGPGAVASMVALGPAFDIALARASGWWLYLAFPLAGMAANLIALVARGGVKLLTFAPLVGKPFGQWFYYAIVTYPLSGATAGLVCALLLFRATGARGGRTAA